MCLAIPGQLISVSDANDTAPASLERTGRVNFAGITKEISLAFTPEAQINDYVIVHAGFALAILDESEALASLQTFQELAAFENGT
ncbi:MAG: HypC/HybG/HupF family hydrogenase formation chaperone [Methylococcales bacterium]|nr:HypC/HybG/HupF family hydrogenase formation chaperone [Methylococcales bacterium]